MKKLLTAGAATLALVLVGCSGFSEEDATAQATEMCQDEVKQDAKYPAAVEFPDEFEPAFREAEQGQGPEGTAYVSVNLNEMAHFKNGFGMPIEYTWACVSYHDEEGAALGVNTRAKEASGLRSGFVYHPDEDRIGW